MKVCEWFGIKPKDGLIGMEIEVEGQNLPNEIPYYWKVEKDGSLRGESAEYILKKPYSVPGVIKALDTLDKCLAESKLEFSHRCSVHVHLNVLDMSRNELINFLYLSYLFDRTLCRIGAREITGNRFCLPIADAEGSVYMFEKLCKTLNRIPIPELGQAKYAAINIVPVSKYGSVEFRMMRGTADVEVLRPWVELLVRLYKYSLKFETIKDMMEGFLDDGSAWCEKVFGKELFNHYQNSIILDDLRINYSLLISSFYEAVYNKEPVAGVEPVQREAVLDELLNAPPMVERIRDIVGIAPPRIVNNLAEYQYRVPPPPPMWDGQHAPFNGVVMDEVQAEVHAERQQAVMEELMAEREGRDAW